MSILFENCDLLLRGEDGVYSTLHGFLGVRGDTIDYIGTEKPTGEYEEHKSMEHKLLMPGLINCHNHSPMVLLRGVGSGLPLREWLFDKVFPIEDRLVPEDIAAGSRLAILEMLASGTTSFSDMYFFPAETVAAVAEAGMKANISRCVQCFDENQTVEQNTQIPQSVELFEKYHNAENGRIRIDFSIHAEYTCTDAVAKYYADYVKTVPDARMHIHLSETEKEQRECIKRHGCTPAEWFERMGVFDVPTGAAHCVWVTDGDIEILKKHGVSAVHNPTSNMKLGSGFAPIPKLMERGINVALGTDGAASNNNLNMFEEMHLASILHNGYHQNPLLMQPEEVLKMATVNGARLQGRSDTGALEVGKKADVVAIDFRGRAHMYPAFEPMTTLVYAAQGSDVSMTMVDGKILYEDGKFTTLNPEKVIQNARAAIRRLHGEE